MEIRQDLDRLLELLPDAAVAICDGAVIAANGVAKRNFISSDGAPVVLELTKYQAEIDGAIYRFASNIKDNIRLFISELFDEENPYTYLLTRMNGYLREELGVIQASLNLLGKRLAYDFDLQKYLCMIWRSQAKLHRMVDNLTDTLDEEDSTFEPQVTDLAELCENLVSTVASLIENPEIKFSFKNLCDNGEAITMGDSVKLERMLLNLISNAARLAPESGGAIGLTLTGSSESFTITVSDNSGGFPKGLESILFNAYTRTESMLSRDMGLGLSSALRVAHQHGGNIIATRHDNITNFSVSIPRKTPPLKLEDSGEIISDDAMTRVLTGLSDVLSWNKFGAPYIER
ncbi:MAG: HAMP domain-containing histidine kinase [Oscillospiraceae bacterium]|nr:HAMP domain-containing histidine kinase [Oscillospiraceae bacterium]